MCMTGGQAQLPANFSWAQAAGGSERYLRNVCWMGFFLLGSMSWNRNLNWYQRLLQKGRRQVIIFFPRRSEAQMGSASIYQTDLHLPACHSPVLLLSQGSASSQTYPKHSKPMAMSSSDLRDRVSSHSQGRGGCAGGGNPAAMEFTSFLWCLIFVICKAIS